MKRIFATVLALVITNVVAQVPMNEAVIANATLCTNQKTAIHIAQIAAEHGIQAGEKILRREVTCKRVTDVMKVKKVISISGNFKVAEVMVNGRLFYLITNEDFAGIFKI